MRRIDIDIERLAQVGTDGTTHSLLIRDTGVGRTVRIDTARELELRGATGTIPLKRTLGTIIENLVGLEDIVAKISLAETDAVGQMLGELVWGNKPGPALEEFWINTTDPLVAGLPWALTQPLEGDALIAQNVPVAVRIGQPRARAGLPKTPTLLFVAGAETDWHEHLKDLSAALGSACKIEAKKPRTLDELTGALKEHSPDIVYYYGHGTIDEHGYFHLAVNGLNHAGFPAAGLQNYLRDALDTRIGRKLSLLYLNCCWSGVSLEAGGPFALGKLVPAFIANRASAITKTVAAQAIDILKQIVLLGDAPHIAVHAAQHASFARRRHAVPGTESQDEPWWMTPTVFANYEKWGETRPYSEKIITDYDSLQLDRIPQCGALRETLKSYDENRITQRQTPKPTSIHLVIWHGHQEDGLESLARRLSQQLCDPTEARAALLSERDIAWPLKYDESADTIPRDQRRRMLRERLVETLSGERNQHAAVEASTVATQARKHLRRGGDKAMWRQAPIDLASLGEPADLAVRKQRLKAMMNDLIIVLEESTSNEASEPRPSPISLLVLLRVGDIGIDIDEVTQELSEKNRTSVVILALDALENLKTKDIQTFLGPIAARDGSAHWRDRLRTIAQRIQDKTKGRYEPTRRELEDIETHIAATEED